MNLVLVLCVATLMAAGQMMFKMAAGRISTHGSTIEFLLSYVSLPMVTALALYAVATILWTFVLTRMPLSLAYGAIALSFVLVPMVGHFAFGESISTAQAAGLALIVVGVAMSGLADAESWQLR